MIVPSKNVPLAQYDDRRHPLPGPRNLGGLGLDSKGHKHVLGLREGSTESTRVVRSLLSDLVERGLDADRARLRADKQPPPQDVI